ncbi:TetR/AcrR family transcriptional regulator [Denitratisoma sp. DHT3]|uniref:TetR/AcrR family transcriptional regulator n=1 Tax=Denitratisoma sp. DHT3 TaxID=1981880 RepID=UPI001645FEF6|nr:TetR/AcrR family transcriptional regulator [Denitratisoma sp. DHT3]
MTTVESGRRPLGRRRTQEERSATTREKVIQAAIDCIVEEGLHNTTAARIAARSGVTWGAIAHQFGDKDSVLFAVVERNAEMYRGLLDAALKKAGATLPERVETLVDVTWKYINEPAAFAFNELIIHNRASSNAKIIGQQEDLSYKQMSIVWDKFFGEFDLPVPKLETARNFTLATLQGLSLMRLITHRRPTFKRELVALKQSVVQMLASET